MMTRTWLLLLLFLGGLCQTSYAQRMKFRNDSTVYGITPADTIVAGRYMLYRWANATLSPIHDFYPPDTNYYIRDFDYLDTKNWYVIVGSRWYGGTSILYKTTDAGTNWQVDTSYYPVSEYRNLNSLQVYDRNRIFLFDNYYISSVYRSEDGGNTWVKWIESFAQHHKGIFVCSDTSLYLWGGFGDGFSAYMFPIPDTASPYADGVHRIRCNIQNGCVVAPYEYGAMPEAYLREVFETVTCPQPQLHQYIFTGNGNWSDSFNWVNNRIPPFELPAGNSIIIDHQQGGNSRLNVEQSLLPGSLLQINSSRNLLVEKQLLMQ